jgi:hypothetical protein
MYKKQRIQIPRRSLSDPSEIKDIKEKNLYTQKSAGKQMGI